MVPAGRSPAAVGPSGEWGSRRRTGRRTSGSPSLGRAERPPRTPGPGKASTGDHSGRSDTVKLERLSHGGPRPPHPGAGAVRVVPELLRDGGGTAGLVQAVQGCING